MKKLKKMLFAGCGILFALVLFGCSQPANSNPDNGGGSGSEESGGNGGGSGSGKSTSLIKFNISNASVLATTGLSNKSRSARAADDEYDSLVAIVEDEEGNETVENVIEVEPELQDWCVPSPVVEVYKCPYTSVESECKGVYTVFDGWHDDWKYTDDTDAPPVSMLMYTKPDGTTVDVLNIDGNVQHYIQLYIKANEGNDYIQFDLNGNAYILADNGGKSVVYRYNPTNDAVTEYSLGFDSAQSEDGTSKTATTWIGDFQVSADGKWIFVHIQIKRDGKQDQISDSVYALAVNSDAKPICIFQNEEMKGWVKTLSYNNENNTLYFYNWDETMTKSGLYKIKRRSDYSFNPADVKRYYKASPWEFWEAAKKYIADAKEWEDADGPVYEKDDEGNIKKDKDGKDIRDLNLFLKDEPDYDGFLYWLKAQCLYDGNPDDLEFNLSWFASEDAKDKNGGDLSWLVPEEGRSLKNEEALEYLLTTKCKVWDEEADEEVEDPNTTLMERLNWYSWGWEEEHTVGNKYGYFLGDFMWTKDGKPAADEYCYFKQDYADITEATCVYNDEGVWVFVNADDGEASDWNHTHSFAFQLTDANGNFKLAQPESLKGKEFKMINPQIEREDSDPWYKKPFAKTSTGIAALDRKGKTVYYHSKGETKDLLASDSYKSQMGETGSIYAFTINEDTLVYNANKGNGGYMMVSVDLKSGESKKLPLNIKVESMLSIK